MNQDQKTEQTVATPPPFCGNDEAAQDQAASPTLAQRIAAMQLDESSAQRLTQLTEDLDGFTPSDEVLEILARGITHDDDVKNADAAGFLRGRNEKIEAMLHPQPEAEDPNQQSTPVFPRYCRRSIWD